MDIQDFRDLIEDIGGPGTYQTADLYRWYVSLMEEQGREPVTHRKFGGVLRSLRFMSVHRTSDGKSVRCWVIPKTYAKRELPG